MNGPGANPGPPGINPGPTPPKPGAVGPQGPQGIGGGQQLIC